MLTWRIEGFNSDALVVFELRQHGNISRTRLGGSLVTVIIREPFTYHNGALQMPDHKIHMTAALPVQPSP
jgi:hypothetical protein